MTQKKILAVDDANTVLMMEQLILREAGYAVVTARDGEEAITKAREERPDLIVMDVVMPKLDGFQACRRIRDEHPALPIIMMTTKGTPVNRAAGQDAGCSAYLTKPIDRPAFLAQIATLLGDGAADGQ
ncbi:MAG: response regulator [Kofleriaceae bacterium]|nr:response regulator [Kofleriaceae bacterium]